MGMVPCIIEQTSRGERSYDIFSRLLSDRIIFLGEEVSDASASLIVAQMLYLEASDPERIFSYILTVQGDQLRLDLLFTILCSISSVIYLLYLLYVLDWRLVLVLFYLPEEQRENGLHCLTQKL